MPLAWNIELFGWLRATQGENVFDRFLTHHNTLLFAYLALHPKRNLPRDELAEMLWPDPTIQNKRIRLNHALWFLRRQLELPGMPVGSVIVSDRNAVRLNPDAVQTDVEAFENGIAASARTVDAAQRLKLLAEVLPLRRGELLPGLHEEWIVTARQRLDDLYLQALKQALDLSESLGDLVQALSFAQEVLKLDALQEEAHCDLMRIFLQLGQPAAAQRQFHELERILWSELGAEPSSVALHYLRMANQRSKSAPPAKPIKPTKPLQLHTTVPPDETHEPSKPSARANLPLQFTRFFGRTEEIRLLSELLDREDCRLLTILGPGGSGKTRLAIELASSFAAERTTDVWFVPLADLTDEHFVPNAILSALGVKPNEQDSPLHQVIRFFQRMSDRQALLILDNYEQLAHQGCSWVGELLNATTNLKCLVTSRHRLNVLGEKEFELKPLGTPDAGALTPEKLLTVPSVQLFVDRAQAVQVYFQITPRNAETVAQLCAKLEGLPLAIELAAAWIQALTPAQILQQLDRRLDLLISRRKDAFSRHRSLRAAIDYSLHLLTPELRKFFCNLSIFQGGCSVEATAAICDLPLTEALENLVLLKERSLVIAEERNDVMRYRLLETLREHALESLTEEERQALQRKHALFFHDLSHQLGGNISGQDQKIKLETLMIEHENLKAAMNWSLEAGQHDLGLNIAGKLALFWSIKGLFRVGEHYLKQFLYRPQIESLPKAMQAYGWKGLAWLSMKRGEYQTTIDLSLKAAALFREVGDELAYSACLSTLGCSYAHLRHPDAVPVLKEALAIAEKLNVPLACAALNSHLGNIAFDEGNWEEAKRLYQIGEKLLASVGDTHRMSITYCMLGQIAMSQQDLDLAEQYLLKAKNQCEMLGDLVGLEESLESLAVLMNRKQDLFQVAAYLRQGLLMNLESERQGRTRNLLLEACVLSSRLGYQHQAARLLGMVSALSKSGNASFGPVAAQRLQETYDNLKSALGQDFEREWNLGYCASYEQMVPYALHTSVLCELPNSA